ncbi:MAG: phenylacetate-CoA oxygenase subunit PaaC [Bacteroidia bacterium]|nr:phenylacetate-CoA oxygenase subunit PaaC [Bacteroidia bacterium]
MNKQEALFKYLLRLGDSALVLSHRLSELCSRGPFLEEDLALTNMSLDLVGRAQALLKYAGELEGKGRTEDDLAYRRSERQLLNHLIAELPNTDFAHTILKQFFIATYDYLLYTKLSGSTDATLAAISAKAVKEAKYHVSHSADWIERLALGTEKSHQKIQSALDVIWSFTGEMFEMCEEDKVLKEVGIAIDLNEIKTEWSKHVKQVLQNASLTIPASDFMQTGGRKGVHTEYLGHMLSEMQYLQRAYPDAKW